MQSLRGCDASLIEESVVCERESVCSVVYKSFVCNYKRNNFANNQS